MLAVPPGHAHAGTALDALNPLANGQHHHTAQMGASDDVLALDDQQQQPNGAQDTPAGGGAGGKQGMRAEGQAGQAAQHTQQAQAATDGQQAAHQQQPPCMQAPPDQPDAAEQDAAAEPTSVTPHGSDVTTPAGKQRQADDEEADAAAVAAALAAAAEVAGGGGGGGGVQDAGASMHSSHTHAPGGAIKAEDAPAHTQDEPAAQPAGGAQPHISSLDAGAPLFNGSFGTYVNALFNSDAAAAVGNGTPASAAAAAAAAALVASGLAPPPPDLLSSTVSRLASTLGALAERVEPGAGADKSLLFQQAATAASYLGVVDGRVLTAALLLTVPDAALIGSIMNTVQQLQLVSAQQDPAVMRAFEAEMAAAEAAALTGAAPFEHGDAGGQQQSAGPADGATPQPAGAGGRRAGRKGGDAGDDAAAHLLLALQSSGQLDGVAAAAAAAVVGAGGAADQGGRGAKRGRGGSSDPAGARGNGDVVMSDAGVRPRASSQAADLAAVGSSSLERAMAAVAAAAAAGSEPGLAAGRPFRSTAGQRPRTGPYPPPRPRSRHSTGTVGYAGAVLAAAGMQDSQDGGSLSNGSDVFDEEFDDDDGMYSDSDDGGASARRRTVRRVRGRGTTSSAPRQQQHSYGGASGMSGGGVSAADIEAANNSRFVMRSLKYTGVYRSRRSQEGWRAQFCYANKVINLGTFTTEDEAARVWNEAARLFRGPEAWLNPVDPPLPADFKEGELHLASEKAAQAVLGAAAIAKLKPPKIVVRP